MLYVLPKQKIAYGYHFHVISKYAFTIDENGKYSELTELWSYWDGIPPADNQEWLARGWYRENGQRKREATRKPKIPKDKFIEIMKIGKFASRLPEIYRI